MSRLLREHIKCRIFDQQHLIRDFVGDALLMFSRRGEEAVTHLQRAAEHETKSHLGFVIFFYNMCFLYITMTAIIHNLWQIARNGLRNIEDHQVGQMRGGQTESFSDNCSPSQVPNSPLERPGDNCERVLIGRILSIKQCQESLAKFYSSNNFSCTVLFHILIRNLGYKLQICSRPWPHPFNSTFLAKLTFALCHTTIVKLANAIANK